MTSEPQQILIDQSKVDAPKFPRDQDWWSRFIPGWITATVRDDGIVALAYNGSHPTGETPEMTPARARRGYRNMADWLTRDARRIAAGIVPETVDEAAFRHDNEMFGDQDSEPEWATPGYDPAEARRA